MTALKSLVFFLLVPALLLGVVPAWISRSDAPLFASGPLRCLAFPLWAAGAGMMVWCFRDFTVRGGGTPAPIDPPVELVTSGPYRYVRNPMYVAGLMALAGWSLWSPSLPLIAAPILFFTATHLFITRYEEPVLRKKFGAAYEDYLKRVPRWIPRFGTGIQKENHAG